jgi:hypothetical protein
MDLVRTGASSNSAVVPPLARKKLEPLCMPDNNLISLHWPCDFFLRRVTGTQASVSMPRIAGTRNKLPVECTYGTYHLRKGIQTVVCRRT